MLLHPNQFSIGHPASPGGPQQPRKTRRTGHKFGEAEELAAANESNKRKRKLFEEQDNDTPGPSGRPSEMAIGIGSPFREAKSRTINAQFESSAYSVERLFTEKELNMAINQATTAASHFFAKMKNTETAPQEATTNGTTNGANGDHASEHGDAMDQDQDSDDVPGASDMVRQVSSNPHATRGATRSALNPTAAIINGQVAPFIYTPPVVLDAKVFQKINAAAPPPTSLSAHDVEQDLKLMTRDVPPDDELCEKFLQAACHPVKARDYQVQPPNFTEPVHEMTSQLRSTAPHLELGLGGIPMSAQSSMAGWSDAGGNTPLGRYGERETLNVGGHGGGVAMTRTASGSGRGRGRGRGG
jgi:hypothetical protein